MASLLQRISRSLLYVLVFLLPLFFLPISVDALELNKQTLLIVLSLASALCLLGSMLAEKRITYQPGWTNLFPLLLLGSVAVSAAISIGPYLSWIGGSKQEYASVFSLLGFTLTFFLIGHAMHDGKAHRVVHFLLLLSAFLAGLFGLYNLFGLGNPAFNTVGTVNAFAIYLSAMAVFAASAFVVHRPRSTMLYPGWQGAVERTLAVGVCLFAFVALLLADDTYAWLTLVIGLSATFGFVLLRVKDFPNRNFLILPLLLLLFSLPFLFALENPLCRPDAPAGERGVCAPVEVTPSFAASWDIAKETLGEHSALFGSGPGTWMHDWARFRTTELNDTAFWDTRFDRGASFALTFLPTAGALGVFLWLVFLFVMGTLGFRKMVSADPRDEWLHVFVIFSAWITLVAGLFLYAANMTLLFLLFAFSGLLVSVALGEPKRADLAKSPRLSLLVSISFVIASVAMLTLLFVALQRYAAEAAFSKAVRLDREGSPVQEVVLELDRAAHLNRYQDLYYRNLAQALVILLGEELRSLQGAGEVSEDRRAFVQALTAASVNAATRATELAPANVQNWTARGAVYRGMIELVGNAGEFAVAAYERASELEPANPKHPLELGKTYLALAEAERTLTAAEDASVREAAERRVEEYLVSAGESFARAVELKADYSPAHYQSALVFERQGRLDEAVGKMESVARHNSLDVGVAFQLGLLYLRRGAEGDDGRAQNAFEHAVALAPSYANARWFLASVYERQGELEKAIEQVEKVLVLNPDNQLVKARLERLRKGVASTALPESIESGDSSAVTE